MENSIVIFKNSITELDKDTVYVTDEALGIFLEIRAVLESIADDLSTLLTGTLPFTPENLEISMQLARSISNLEDFLRIANRNSAESASRIIDVKDILVRFGGIRGLMIHPSTNRHFRSDAIQLFIKIGNLYPEEQIREFIGLLDEEELQYILQIVAQEKTLIEKPLTNSLIHILASQRMRQLKTKTIERADSER